MTTAAGRTATTLWQAVRVIVVADITMALDNMLAVGGASGGNLFLLLFGLALSIPFVVFTSGLLTLLMDRYPAIVYVGAALLGKVSAEMVLTDPIVLTVVELSQRALWAAEALAAVGVVAAGKLWLRLLAARAGAGAERLGYSYEDRASLLAALRASDPRWERFGDEYDEHAPNLWERFDRSFRGIRGAAAAPPARGGGRRPRRHRRAGGGILLAGVPTALHVRVVAPLAARIERIMRREHADHDSVRRMIERIDRERAGFVRAIYHRPWDAPGLHDATYDTSLLEQPAVIQDILSRLAARDGADHAAAQRILERRRAGARVRAALWTDPHLQLPTLEVFEEGDGILVSAVLHRPEEKRRIEEVACAQAGGQALRFDLRYR